MVWGLTFRCVIKRVVKNDCNKAGRLAGSRIQALPSFLQPLGGCPQQLRSAGQIPIGVGNVSMPEIGRQDWQEPLGILTIAIPAQQSLNRKSVPAMPHLPYPPLWHIPDYASWICFTRAYRHFGLERRGIVFPYSGSRDQ